MTELNSLLNLARSTARRSQTDHFEAIGQSKAEAELAPERNTFQGYDPATGLLKRQPLRQVVEQINSADSGNNPAIIADGVQVFNRPIRIGQPVLTLPTAGKARLIGQYLKRPAQTEQQVLRRRSQLKSPFPIGWIAVQITLDGILFELPLSFIPTYDAYVSAPFATPVNFTQFTTSRNFAAQGLQLSVGGGIAATLFGRITTSDPAFSTNHTIGVFGFNYQLFRATPGELNLTVTIEQDDGVGGTSAENAVVLVGSTGPKQPNGLYLIEVDQTIFASNLLVVNQVAKTMSVSVSYADG
jgi:hypothetical protein